MSKKIIRENYRVEVYPDFGFCFRRQEETHLQHVLRLAEMQKRYCETIEKEIKRHVDDLQAVVIVSDATPVCEHCGSPWTESSPDYNGGCCQADQDPEDERERTATLQEDKT